MRGEGDEPLTLFREEQGTQKLFVHTSNIIGEHGDLSGPVPS